MISSFARPPVRCGLHSFKFVALEREWTQSIDLQRQTEIGRGNKFSVFSVFLVAENVKQIAICLRSSSIESINSFSVQRSHHHATDRHHYPYLTAKQNRTTKLAHSPTAHFHISKMNGFFSRVPVSFLFVLISLHTSSHIYRLNIEPNAEFIKW